MAAVERINTNTRHVEIAFMENLLRFGIFQAIVRSNGKSIWNLRSFSAITPAVVSNCEARQVLG
jgi:hypothetical protein